MQLCWIYSRKFYIHERSCEWRAVRYFRVLHFSRVNNRTRCFINKYAVMERRIFLKNHVYITYIASILRVDHYTQYIIIRLRKRIWSMTGSEDGSRSNRIWFYREYTSKNYILPFLYISLIVYSDIMSIASHNIIYISSYSLSRNNAYLHTYA